MRKARARLPRFEIGGVEVEPGSRATVHVPVARRYTHTEVFLTVHVVRGKIDGPRLFVTGAVHGDEINGVEIIRRLTKHSALKSLRGTLIAVPVVNVYGFLNHVRYLPDRRDLNRCFPGSPGGSLTSRLAHQLMQEVVLRSTHGVDLHTGAVHRTNLPHIRACLDDPETERLARAFGTPVIMNANVRDGSLRQAVLEKKLPMLLYEAGEALRFDELAIRAGVRGVVNVMRCIGMLPEGSHARATAEPFVARSSSWVRAPESGVLRAEVRLGAKIDRGQRVGVIADPLGEAETPVKATAAGVLIGRTNLPLVNEGDALFHVAQFDRPASVVAQLETFHASFEPVAG